MNGTLPMLSAANERFSNNPVDGIVIGLTINEELQLFDSSLALSECEKTKLQLWISSRLSPGEAVLQMRRVSDPWDSRVGHRNDNVYDMFCRRRTCTSLHETLFELNIFHHTGTIRRQRP